MENLSLFRTLGSQLVSNGKWFLQNATPLIKTRLSAEHLLSVVSLRLGLARDKMYSADSYHDTINIDSWKSLIENDWSDKKKYLSETYDCDNYAGSFSSHMAEIYELNSVGRLTCELLDPATNKHIGWHRCCVFITSELDVYLLETQTDKFVKIEEGKPMVIDNWKYIPFYYEVN